MRYASFAPAFDLDTVDQPGWLAEARGRGLALGGRTLALLDGAPVGYRPGPNDGAPARSTGSA